MAHQAGASPPRRLQRAGMDAMRDQARMNTMSSSIAGIIEQLRSQLSQLEREIKADEAGEHEYREQLEKLRREREEIVANLEANRELAREFDERIGPFQRKYHTLTGDISTLYANAKAEHRKGVELLQAEFDYNPLFRTWDKPFFAIPFVPK